MNPKGKMTWESMSVDEYAELEAANGVKLVRTRHLWWRRVRPFFYRPLFPLLEIIPGEQKRPFPSFVGGVQHLVPNGVPANSHLNFLLFDAPDTYSLGSLKPGDRYHIRRAMRTFSVRPLVDFNEFVIQGHAVYLSFYERTQYSYQKERTDQRLFAAWARALFRSPKVRIFGAFNQEELVSVSVSYLVEDVVFTATFFSKSEALTEHVSDLMLHTLRERAAATENVKLIFASMAGMERGLDNFYLRRGAQVVSRPAALRVNPVTLGLLSYLMKDKYEKLYSSLS